MRNADDLLDAAAGTLPDMLDRFRLLVDCESPSDDPLGLQRCAALIRPWLADALGRSARSTRIGENVHVLAEAPDPRVLVLGHFDTVWPVGTTADRPFSITGGIATGPGTFDMKGGIVQALAAIELLADASHVSVLLTSDEETGSASSRQLIEEQARKAGAVLVCEPSADGGAVKIGRKGLAAYRVAVTGRAAHAGLEPELGVNAGVELAHQILAIAGLASENTSVVPAVIAGGTTVNTVPEYAECSVDARSWSVPDLEKVDRAMLALTPRLPGATVTVTGGIARLPFEESSARGLYREAAAAARTLGMAPLRAVRSGGASDGNFTAAIGVPTLDGLGAVGGHPHARDEHVDVNTMPARVALLATLLERLRHWSPAA
ncbi:M20 family metallopeptidase [Nocardia sienata]|uniref:M20 family metallopeptidase n=1 Tax=Nocardia sienata TaxID=248552 RepID=UPI0007A4BD79|nr:M20 family metallopeptidase [Nocardia sienata]